jgi:uncharacterized Zn finger protein
MSKYIIKLSSKIIAYEWWGQQWCQNIANYADCYNRLERGRAYIRKGAIKDLVIEGGHISAVVAGTRTQPYQVEIDIAPVSKNIAEITLSQIKDINTLKNGIVPEDYSRLFTINEGLFPTAQEIHFSCSCPDVAQMCKHVASVLYAIGSILDQEPLVLLDLRGIDVDKYLDSKLIEATNEMLKDINSRSVDERVIEDDMLSDLFGIEISTTLIENDPSAHSNEVRIAEEVHIIELLSKSKRKKLEQPKTKKNPIDGYQIRQFDLDGNFISKFSSYEELEEQTQIGIVNIMRACSGKKNTAGGYQWRKERKEEPIRNIAPIRIVSSVPPIRPVDCFTDDGTHVAHYDSVKAAARAIGINDKSIRDAAKGVQKHAAGLVWKYSEYTL